VLLATSRLGDRCGSYEARSEATAGLGVHCQAR